MAMDISQDPNEMPILEFNPNVLSGEPPAINYSILDLLMLGMIYFFNAG